MIKYLNTKESSTQFTIELTVWTFIYPEYCLREKGSIKERGELPRRSQDCCQEISKTENAGSGAKEQPSLKQNVKVFRDSRARALTAPRTICGHRIRFWFSFCHVNSSSKPKPQ